MSKQTLSWADDEDESDAEVPVIVPIHEQVRPAEVEAAVLQRETSNPALADAANGSFLKQAANSQNTGRGPALPDRPPFRAYVGNLPHAAEEQDIGSYFHSLGCTVLDVHLSRRDDGASKGFCHMEFGDQSSLRKALEQGGVNFMGRPLRTDIAEPRPGGSSGGSRYGGGSGGGGRSSGGQYGGGHDRGGGYGSGRPQYDHHRYVNCSYIVCSRTCNIAPLSALDVDQQHHFACY